MPAKFPGILHCSVAALLLVSISGAAVLSSRTVEYLRPQLLQIETTPEWVVGLDGDLDFHDIVSAAVSENVIAIADGGASTLYFFDPAGQFLAQAGRKGEGPGEFSGLTGVNVVLGEFVAFDQRLGRISRFDAGGEYRSSFRFSSPSGKAVGYAMPLGDGSGFVALFELWSDVSTEEPRTRLPVEAALFSGEGVFLRSLAKGLGREISPKPSPKGFAGTVFGIPAAAWTTVFGVTDGTVLLSQTELWELVEVSAADGTEVGRLKRNIDLSLKPGESVRLMEEHLEEGPNGPQLVVPSIRRQVEAMGFPASLPAFSTILSGVDGEVWVGEHARSWEEPKGWDVFDSTRRWIGRVQAPPRTKLLAIGDGFVLGRIRTELDVHAVGLFRVIEQ